MTRAPEYRLHEKAAALTEKVIAVTDLIGYGDIFDRNELESSLAWHDGNFICDLITSFADDLTECEDESAQYAIADLIDDLKAFYRWEF